MCERPPVSHDCVKFLVPTIPLPLWWPEGPDEETHARPYRIRGRRYRCTTAGNLESAKRRILCDLTATCDHRATALRVKAKRRLACGGATNTRSQTTELARQAASRGPEALLVKQSRSRKYGQSLNRHSTSFQAYNRCDKVRSFERSLGQSSQTRRCRSRVKTRSQSVTGVAYAITRSLLSVAITPLPGMARVFRARKGPCRIRALAAP